MIKIHGVTISNYYNSVKLALVEKELDFDNWKADQLEQDKSADAKLYVTVDPTSFDKIAARCKACRRASRLAPTPEL